MTAPREDWREVCARRLTATLARKPRRKNSRDYMASLPKRAPIIVAPNEFIAAKPKPARAPEPDKTASLRKDRLRPRAKRIAVAAAPPPRPLTMVERHRILSGKACLDDHHFTAFQRPVVAYEKVPRDADEMAALRLRLHIEQGGHCAICGGEMAGEGVKWSLDHVVPRSLGGFDGIGNYVLTHGECNGLKSNRIPTGCELVWLLAINARLGAQPQAF